MRKVYIRGTQNVKMDEDRNDDGNILFSSTFDELKWNGEQVHPLQSGYNFTSVASNGVNETVSHFDIEITTEKLLQGGMFWIENPNDVDKRDYITFSVIDRNGVVMHPDYGISLFTLMGLTAGEDVIELQPIVKYSKVKKGSAENGYFYYPLEHVKDSSAVVPGIFLRSSYHSYSTVPIKYYMEIITYEK